MKNEEITRREGQIFKTFHKHSLVVSPQTKFLIKMSDSKCFM